MVRLWLDETAADRVAGELDTVAHAELLEHVGAVALDGLLADDERAGDLAVVVSLGDELDDLQLAWGEGIGVVHGWVGEVAADGVGDRTGIKE